MPSARRSARRPLRATNRGFTLVELLLVMAMLAVLTAVAIVGFRKYVHNAQGAEARVVMGLIRDGEESYRVEMLKYLTCSTSLTDYYPNATPNDSRWAWRRPTDTRYESATTGWVMLGVNPDYPVRYGYAVVAGTAPTPLPAPDPAFAKPPVWPSNLTSGTPWFVVAAKNQHFNPAPGLPSLMITTSYDGTVYSENDDR
jgi:type IV pilus assembly protein PilA